MSKQNHVLEIAVFAVKKEYAEKMVDLRESLRRALRNFPGLLELHAYEPVGEGRIFADIAKWDTLENAMAAAKAFENGDERFMPYMAAIEELKFMGHFAPDKA